MHQRYLLIVTALAEVGTGLLLLLLPRFPLMLLLGIEQAAPEVGLISRVFGAALLAIGVACWLARGDQRSPAQRGLVVGVLIYDVATTALLAYAGLGLGLVGIALWPAAALHAVFAVWCVACLWPTTQGKGAGTSGKIA